MRRAIHLAMRGRGRVEPNPMVGCVIVKDVRIIGEGYHQQYGGPHAEPNALAACTESPAGATAYVTLEPCCHTNKQTPPCVPRLIAAKVSRVVIGCVDPNPQVAGRGILELRAAGIVVGRQRPDTASGVIFVTLEDETGCINVVVWRNVADRQRRELLGSQLMAVEGILEREGEVVHVIAHRLTERWSQKTGQRDKWISATLCAYQREEQRA